ncbi:MAG: methylated-DNA--[protein]-cysteine S-methyltransferase, partial [Gemmataceae bacterium]
MISMASTDIISTRFDSPVGLLDAAATDDGVCLLEFAGQRGTLQAETVGKRMGKNVIPGTHPFLEDLRHELEAYFAGKLREFLVPLVYPGTPFQVRVWTELQRIPYGATRSYEDIARAVGSANAVRAVGTA